MTEVKPKKSRWRWLAKVIAVIAFVAIPLVRWLLFETDHQYANMSGTLLFMISAFIVWVLVVTRPGARIIERLVVFVSPAVLVYAFFSFFDYAGLSGELIPNFRLKGAKRSRFDRIESASNAKDAPQDLGKLAFLQFLGNDRNGVITEPRFSVAWDKKLPKILWKHEIGAGWSGFVVDGSLAYTLEQIDDFESLSAFQIATGEVVWQHKMRGRHFNPLGGLGPRATPTITILNGKHVVVAQTAMGIVTCVDALTGKPIWECDLLKKTDVAVADSEATIMWGRSGSPLVDSGLVVIPLGGKGNDDKGIRSLIALSLETGDEVWRNGTAQIAYASPSVIDLDGKKQIVSVNENVVTSHDITTGQLLWTTPWVSHSNGDACASQAVPLGGNRLLLSKGYAQGSKVVEVTRTEDKSDDSKGAWEVREVWTSTKVLKTKFTNAIFFEGKLYALSDGVLECVNPADGKREWRGGRFGQGQALIVNGSILVSGEDGRVAIVDRTSGKTVAEIPVLDGITWNVPCVAGPYLLVRNGEQVACLVSDQLDDQIANR